MLQLLAAKCSFHAGSLCSLAPPVVLNDAHLWDAGISNLSGLKRASVVNQETILHFKNVFHYRRNKSSAIFSFFWIKLRKLTRRSVKITGTHPVVAVQVFLCRPTVEKQLLIVFLKLHFFMFSSPSQVFLSFLPSHTPWLAGTSSMISKTSLSIFSQGFM